MTAKNNPARSKMPCWLGWLLFLLTVPALIFLASNYTKANGIVQRDQCIGNLKRIDDAKEEWALKNKKRAGETPDAGDLKDYLKCSVSDLHCPSQGQYKLNAIGANPQCSVAGHQLP